MDERAQGRHRVVVVGAGFGGLFATKALKNAPVDVTLINGTRITCSSRCSTRSRPASCPKARSHRRSGRSCGGRTT